MAPKLYYSELSPPSRSVLLTANALGLELDLKVINLATGEHLSPEFLKVYLLKLYYHILFSYTYPLINFTNFCIFH